MGKLFSQTSEIIFLSTLQMFHYFYLPFLETRASKQSMPWCHVSTKLSAQQKGLPCLWLHLPRTWRLLTHKGSHDKFDKYIFLCSGNAWHSQETKGVSSRCGCQKDTIYLGLESSEASEIMHLQQISISQSGWIHLCLIFWFCFQYSWILPSIKTRTS